MQRAYVILLIEGSLSRIEEVKQLKIGIVNYGMGNLGSVKRKLDRIGEESIISSKPEELKNCSKLILPGVGHFANAVKEIKSRSIWSFKYIRFMDRE